MNAKLFNHDLSNRPTGDVHVSNSPIRLRGRDVLRVTGDPHKKITVLRGTVWITQEADPEDIELKAGQTFNLSRRGLVLVQAMPAAKGEQPLSEVRIV
jgi:hypothetical protein